MKWLSALFAELTHGGLQLLESAHIPGLPLGCLATLAQPLGIITACGPDQPAPELLRGLKIPRPCKGLLLWLGLPSNLP